MINRELNINISHLSQQQYSCLLEKLSTEEKEELKERIEDSISCQKDK